MLKTALSCLLAASTLSAYPVFAETAQEQPKNATVIPFQSFTGKISKNKVRLRLQPNLDSHILKELNRGDLLTVVGESEDFYVVQAPADLKGFVFRTYILDNVVEGNKVNVRLEPNVDAPVVAQLNAGDRVNGTVSPLNSKWLEIVPPTDTHFYVAKEYVENVGDANFIHKLLAQKEEISQLLQKAYSEGHAELSKAYPQMDLDPILLDLNRVTQHSKDFPEETAQAKEMIRNFQETYLKKKIAYLESEYQTSENLKEKNSQLNNEIRAQQDKLARLEQKAKDPLVTDSKGSNSTQFVASKDSMTGKMALWIPAENSYYQEWLKDHPGQTEDDFYKDQSQNTQVLKGKIEPYQRLVKNRPGDYLLLDAHTHLPIAYLYSTKINLEDKVGQQISVEVVERDNHHFAFPAYFVLSIQ